MPTTGRRKQRYVLDIDDVVRDGFMTTANAEALMRGLNGSGGTVKLSVPMGGTNNGAFVDQELLKYDAASRKIMSSGFVSGGGGSGTVFVPWSTGVYHSSTGIDTASVSSLEIQLASQSFVLPTNSVWSEVSMFYSFGLGAAGLTASGLQLRFGTDILPASTIMQPSATKIFQVAAPTDTDHVTWVAMGTVPSSRAFDNPLVVKLYGKPQDIPGLRSLVTRVSYRGAVLPPTGAPKGVPIFITPVTVHPRGLLTQALHAAWQTFDVSAYVPDGASALILSADCYSALYTEAPLTVRASASLTNEYLLITGAAAGGGDFVAGNNQGLYPLSSIGGVRSFQWHLVPGFASLENVTIQLVGYIT